MQNNPSFKGTFSSWDAAQEKMDFEPLENNLIYCEKENALYIYNSIDSWHIIEIPEEMSTGISLYDMNKQLVEQQGSMKEGEKRHARSLINQLNRKSGNNFYMLLFKDISYYTLFQNVDIYYECDTLGTAVLECLDTIGEIYSIEETDNGNSFEIWIKSKETNKIIVGYLFPYDQGVVTVGRGGK